MNNKKHIFCVAFTTFFLSFGGTSFAAQEITVEQAKTIHHAFQQRLDQLVQASNENISLDGELLIEPVDTYYAVTLPHIKGKLPDGGVMDYGIIALNLVPDVVEGQWMVSMALPTEVATKDKTGEVLSKMSVATQKFNGVWSENLGWFKSVNAQWGGVAFDDKKTKSTIKFDQLSFQGNTEPGLDSKRLNVVGDMNASGVTVAGGVDDKGVLTIGDITMTYDIADLEWSMGDHIQKMMEQSKSDEFAVPLGPDFGEIATQFAMKNIQVSSNDTGRSFSIASFATKGTYASREEGLIDSETQLDIQGIQTTADPMLIKWLPESITSDVQMNNFPRQAMIDWAQKQIEIQEKKTDEQKQEKIKLSVPPNMEEIKAAFVNAGTEYKINSFSMKTPMGAGIDIDGNVVATEGAPYVATGQFGLAFMGLDLVTSELQKKISEMLTAPKDGKNEKQTDIVTPMMAQQGLMGVMMLQSFGKTEKTPDGKTTTRFDITLPREGGILINGQDVGALMGAFSAVKEKAQ